MVHKLIRRPSVSMVFPFVTAMLCALAKSFTTHAKSLGPVLSGAIDGFKVDNVECILSDMDGTLLQSSHGISERSFHAIKRVQSLGVRFFPATGRTRKSMALAGGDKLIEVLGGKIENIPGVYAQGLQVYNMEGTLIYEELLDSSVISMAEGFCLSRNLSVIAYAGDRILAQRRTYFTDIITDYAEPVPEECHQPLSNVADSGTKINKLIILDREEVLVDIRPELEKLLEGKASLTKAVPGMLEVLPFGASKGKGVQVLLNSCGIAPERCLAFGDGENDIEMIRLVKYGIAMANARSLLKQVSTFITDNNNEDGVAKVLEKLFPIERLYKY